MRFVPVALHFRRRALALALSLPLPVAIPRGSAASPSRGDAREHAAAALELGASSWQVAFADDDGPAQQRSRRKRRGTRSTAAPARWTEPYGSTALATDLNTMLSGRVRSGHWGAMVVSITRRDTLYSYAADSLLQPASNMKLFTTALALEQLGPDHRFSTDALRDGDVSADGTLNGNLILRGDGDPGLSGRYVDGGPDGPMNALAAQVSAAGIKRVRGAILADASAFDPQRIPEGWKTKYLQSSYAARVSALSLNENLVWIVVTPRASGTTADVSLEPNTDIPVTGSVRVVAGRGARVRAYTKTSGGIQVGGWIGTKAGERRYELVVDDPTAFAAGAFKKALAARGISVAGATRFAATPAGAVKIASLPSPPVSRLVSAMNGESINHFAELLFRDAARAAEPARVGSIEAANRLLRSFMTDRVGAIPGSVVATDGSGLSVLDRATPRSLVQLLSYAHRAPWSAAYHASLPVAGETDLLRHRMRYTPAQGNLHAKTGTTNDIISLGGYVTAHNGELLAFAFIYNGRDRWNAKTTIDQMGATLAAFDRPE
jgi:D-alanyl-D-alanine carboxypeptidase/D-alanyl-D-alanine-endopeptidase (penicillin-binding protein 4)